MRNHLYSVLFDGKYPFDEIFDTVTTIDSPDEMVDENSVLVLWGGGDISPSLYGHKVHRLTNADDKLSQRDAAEWALANKAVSMGIPVIGICRGAQMMCALSGGYLVQDVTGHTRPHDIVLVGSTQTIRASSLHHQMLYPFDVQHEMIAVSSPKLSPFYRLAPDMHDLEPEDMPVEPEIVWFPKTKALAIQGHPEFMGVGTPYVQYCFELVVKYALR